ncbi:hypothetical protein TU52_02740 [Bacillus cereus]|nr:hypothetical protein TU52_02740 [Bacillus cereus]
MALILLPILYAILINNWKIQGVSIFVGRILLKIIFFINRILTKKQTVKRLKEPATKKKVLPTKNKLFYSQFTENLIYYFHKLKILHFRRIKWRKKQIFLCHFCFFGLKDLFQLIQDL